jgi:drug/metabolite transporter (DMT)-like permease
LGDLIATATAPLAVDAAPSTRLRRLLLGPGLSVGFVILWTGGYIAGPIGVTQTGPLTITFWRFTVAATALALLAVLTRAPWPRGRAAWAQLIAAGLLMQAGMFGLSYLGLSLGVPVGLVALLNGASPVLVAIGGTVALLPLAGTVAFAAGTLVQRRTGASMDLRTGAAVQMAVAAVVMLPLAVIFEGGVGMPVNGASMGALGFLALGNSGVAFALMFLMLRHRKAADTARLLLLVAPLAAVAAWPLFGERPDAFLWIGLAVTVAGIALAIRPARPAEPA